MGSHKYVNFMIIMMESKRGRLLKVTSIFVTVEAILLYYAIGVPNLDYYPGIPFKFFPGLGYIVKTLYPDFWFTNYNPMWPGKIISAQQKVAIQIQVHNAETFLFVFWYVMMMAAAVTAVLYAIKLSGIYGVTPRTPLQNV